MGGDLVVQLDQGSEAILPDIKADGDDGQIRPRHGVHVLDPVHLPEELLQGGGDQLLHLLGARPGHVHIDIRQGHLDLRLLLARREQQGRRPGDYRKDNEDDRQVALEKLVDDPGGQGMLLCRHLLQPSRRAPLRARSTPPTTMLSPGSRPERISSRPSISRPVLTSR